MHKLDIVFLFVIAAFIGYYMCKKESFEGFAAIDDARQAVKEIYNADIDAIRNLATVATKLQAGGLTVPGVMKTNKINLTNDKWENIHEGDGKSYVVSDDGNYKKLMLVGHKSAGADARRIGMWDDVEISRNLQVNGNVKTGTLTSDGRLHISGNELLYLLNKNGVIIGKEWGGNGNLSVQGNTFVNGDIITSGGNNWLFHTPDDERRTMYIVPSKGYGNQDWNWDAAIELNPDGGVVVKNGIYSKKNNYLYYPEDAIIYQNIFEPYRSGIIKKNGSPGWDETSYVNNKWNEEPKKIHSEHFIKKSFSTNKLKVN